MCVLFPVSFVHTTYLIPQREEEREEKPLILSLVKFSDLLLTTFRLLGRGVVTGGEKKEIYILYINIYVNCIVLLYRHWHYCLPLLPLPFCGLIVQPSQTVSLAYLGFIGEGFCESGWGSVLALWTASALFWWEEGTIPCHLLPESTQLSIGWV